MRKIPAGAATLLCILSVLSAPFTASSADYPRRIAVAPFVNLTGQDEIKPVVSVLPRLLATRLMAMAGAEMVLLAPGEKTPEAAAKDAGVPLLLQGTVSKLGRGYSIDTTVTDLSTGKAAGAFFASAATEDEIIPQLGILSAEMADKLFGVKTALPQPPPAPGPVAPAAAVPAPPAAAVAIPAPQAPAAAPAVSAGGASAAAPGPVAAPAAAAQPQGPWEPESIVKLGSSDKIPDEVFRVAMGDVNGDGEPEIVALGKRTIYFYQVKGDTVVPLQPVRIQRGLEHHYLNVELFDVDGDGRPEILVTDLVNNRLRSFVMKHQNGTFEVVATDIPYYLVVLSDVEGKPALAGQATGFEKIFYGPVYLLNYAGGKAKEASKLPVPSDDGIFGLNAVRIGKEGRYVYLDADERLRLLDGKGKTLGRTKDYYSGARDEVTLGPTPRGEVGPQRTWIRGRVVPLGGEPGSPYLFLRKAEGVRYMKELRLFGSSKLVIGRYDGTSFGPKVSSDTIESLITDAYPVAAKGGREALVAASVLEETSSVSSEPVSRLSLYRVR